MTDTLTDRLAEVLKPFAEIAQSYEDVGRKNGFGVHPRSHRVSIGLGECQDALKALAAYTAAKAQPAVSGEMGDVLGRLENLVSLFDGGAGPEAHKHQRASDIRTLLTAFYRAQRLFSTSDHVAAWVNNALDDPKVCSGMKADITVWLEAIQDYGKAAGQWTT